MPFLKYKKGGEKEGGRAQLVKKVHVRVVARSLNPAWAAGFSQSSLALEAAVFAKFKLALVSLFSNRIGRQRVFSRPPCRVSLLGSIAALNGLCWAPVGQRRVGSVRFGSVGFRIVRR